MTLQTDINKQHFVYECDRNAMRDLISELTVEMNSKERSIRQLMIQNHQADRVDKYSKIVLATFTQV